MILYDHQKAAIDFAKARRYSYLAIPCAGGKTLTSLLAIQESKSTLIICPASLLFVWHDEIIKWFGEDERKNIQIINSPNKRIKKSRYVILSYERALSFYYYEQLMSISYDSVIIDEAHLIKNQDAKRTIATLGWQSDRPRLITKKDIQRAILLSGTPMMQRPVELYAPLRGLRPDLLGPYKNFEDYAIRFCAGYKNAWHTMVASGTSHTKDLAERVRDFLFFVDKEEINKKLPPIVHQITRFDVGQKIVKEQAAYGIEQLEYSEISISFSGMAELQHRLAFEKLEMSINYILNLAKSDEKIVVFSWHTDIIEALADALAKEYKVSVIDGKVTTVKRVSKMEDFQNGQSNILICQIKAAGVGINLNKARHVVFVEFSWNPGDLEQCYKRVHRGDIKLPVTVHYLVASNSLDDYKLRNVMKKQERVDTFNKLVMEKDSI